MSERSNHQKHPPKPPNVSQPSDTFQYAERPEDRPPATAAARSGPSSTSSIGHSHQLSDPTARAEVSVSAAVTMKDGEENGAADGALRLNGTSSSGAHQVSDPRAAAGGGRVTDDRGRAAGDGGCRDGSTHGLELLSAVAVSALAAGDAIAAVTAPEGHCDLPQPPNDPDRATMRDGVTTETRAVRTGRRLRPPITLFVCIVCSVRWYVFGMSLYELRTDTNSIQS